MKSPRRSTTDCDYENFETEGKARWIEIRKLSSSLLRRTVATCSNVLWYARPMDGSTRWCKTHTDRVFNALERPEGVRHYVCVRQISSTWFRPIPGGRDGAIGRGNQRGRRAFDTSCHCQMPRHHQRPNPNHL